MKQSTIGVRIAKASTFGTLLAIVALLIISALIADQGSSLAVSNCNTEGSSKPSGGLTVSLQPNVDVSASGEAVSAKLTICSAANFSNLTVSVNASGSASLASDGSLTFGAQSAGSKLSENVAYSVAGSGAGEIRATVEAFDGAGNLAIAKTAIIYILSSGGEAVHGTVGTLDLELKQLSRAHDGAALSDAEYEAAVEAALGAGAAESVEAVTAEGSAAGPGTVTISGQIRWTDSVGTTHPVRAATVEIRDKEAVGSVVVATLTTDDNGNYGTTVDNDDGAGENGRDIFVRALAQSTGFKVRPSVAGMVHRIDSSVNTDVPDATALVINLTANNTADNNTAFSVNDALVTANRYVVAVNGSAFAVIDVIFPGAGSFFNGTNLNLLRLDRWDWDVTHHEYGHYVQSQLNISNSPGGPHSSLANLSETRGSKDVGTRLAWGEAWPTYFGTSLQQVQGTAAFNIPNVGDTRYQDTEDASINYSLESQTGSASKGEDQERAIMRTLWDMFDSASDPGDTKMVALGDISIWNTIDDADPTTLSAAYAALIDGQTVRDITRYGCIFTEHKVAPELTAPADKFVTSSTPPTFTWTANGGGPTYKHNKFIVKFYDAQLMTQLHASIELSVTTYTPSQADWDTILDQADILSAGGPVIHWFVEGSQDSAPATGPYTSCSQTLIQDKLDLIFTIDTTASMFDDIDLVKASATDIINAISGSGADFRIGLVTYRDHPISPYGDPGDYPSRIELNFTTNGASVQTAIKGIVVDGGADIPESVFSGLMTSIGFPWRDNVKKAIIMMGDAPPHDPEPVTGFTQADVTAAAFAVDPVSIFPIIIGSDPDALSAFEQLADETGGEIISAPTAAEVVQALLDAIDSILQGPTANAGGPYKVGVGEKIVFDGSGSIDVDGEIVLYEWDFESDGTYDVSSADPTTSFTYPGKFSGVVTIQVTDDNGQAHTATAPVQVNPDPLVVDFAFDPAAANKPVKFTSTISGGTLPYSCEWDLGQDGTVDGTDCATFTKTFFPDDPCAQGTFVLELAVTDNNGVQDSAKKAVNVMPQPNPCVEKSPALSNLFLTGQGTKIPPATCLGGTDGNVLSVKMNTKVSGLDKAGDPRAIGGFSFKVNYDETKVCVTLSPAEVPTAGNWDCIIYDSVTKPTLQGTATITCNQLGKAPISPPPADNLSLASVLVQPMPDEYSIMKPNNGNGNVIQILNKACKLTDTQGDPIKQSIISPTCTDADVTIRYLEGDVRPDCRVDTLDTQIEAFRWGSQKGTLLYSDFFNLEPSKPQQDDDIDINDLQFVYGRFGSTCENPHPKQNPVNPKATP